MKSPIVLILAALVAGAPALAASPAHVAFRNELPGTYRLERVRFWVDGELRYDGAAPFEAPLAPGPHVVSVSADYRLHDALLPYVDGYRVELHSADDLAEGRAARALAVEAGDATTPLDKRARIVWR
jgi:hypothetical protein